MAQWKLLFVSPKHLSRRWARSARRSYSIEALPPLFNTVGRCSPRIEKSSDNTKKNLNRTWETRRPIESSHPSITEKGSFALLRLWMNQQPSSRLFQWRSAMYQVITLFSWAINDGGCSLRRRCIPDELNANIHMTL